MQRLTSLTAILAVTGFLVGCGDDDDGGPAAVGPGPALTPEQCPAAPADVTIDEIAPVWGGLIVVNATVPSGTVTGFDLELFDPTRDAWTRTYGDPWQREDGRYAFSLRPGVTEQSKDSEFKVRVRSRLEGCAPSAWTEGPTFTLGDPLTDTSWRATWESGVLDGNLSLNRIEHPLEVATSSTPRIDGSLTHTVTFAADGVFDEVFSFALENGSEPLDGCSFTLRYSGTWEFAFSRGSLNVVISDRLPIENAADGSSCETPILATIAINDAMLLPNLAIPGIVMSTSALYDGLLSTPAGPVYLESYPLTAALQNSQVFAALSWETSLETGMVAGYIGTPFWLYEQQ